MGLTKNLSLLPTLGFSNPKTTLSHYPFCNLLSLMWGKPRSETARSLINQLQACTGDNVDLFLRKEPVKLQIQILKELSSETQQSGLQYLIWSENLIFPVDGSEIQDLFAIKTRLTAFYPSLDDSKIGAHYPLTKFFC
jgi:hypothetical protein